MRHPRTDLQGRNCSWRSTQMRANIIIFYVGARSGAGYLHSICLFA